MEVFGKFFSLILGFILLFIAPISLSNMRKSMLEDMRFITEADRFLDHVRYRGVIRKEDISVFLEKLSETEGFKKLYLSHRRRAVKPIFENKKIKETKEFFLEYGFEEIRELIEQRGSYPMSIGDELYLSIEKEKIGFPLFYNGDIRLGGMIENELTEH